LRLIVGLGNPGREYERSRHNVGFRCLDTLARRHHWSFNHQQMRAMLAQGEYAGQRVLLAKPLTYMNLSGESVAPLMRRHGVQPSDLLVVYDDMALPLGRIRIRPSGSAGGHNGMQSIISRLGSAEFPRLRVGIGPPQGMPGRDHVLNTFTREEARLMESAYDTVADAIDCILAEGLDAAMNRFNALPPSGTTLPRQESSMPKESGRGRQ
jgi:peptidyl-tRNA hydrolase, PTH1 family